MKRRDLLSAIAAVALAGLAHAQGAGDAMTEGEVRKVDRPQGKLTLRHGPIASLDMPAMTMVFKVADPKLLDGLKPGDKVRFAAERGGGTFTVTAIEPAAP
jgi:Cu(I)/Ag(I) efflux system periplasmic protein CusF